MIYTDMVADLRGRKVFHSPDNSHQVRMDWDMWDRIVDVLEALVKERFPAVASGPSTYAMDALLTTWQRLQEEIQP